jgi:MoaA/NifB/PqqE/SkfB family radical SAM enzyme
LGKKLIAIEAPEPYVAITWQVNNFCNFKCSYCNPGNWGGSNRNEGNLEKYIENLGIIVNRYRSAGITITAFEVAEIVYLPCDCYIGFRCFNCD